VISCQFQNVPLVLESQPGSCMQPAPPPRNVPAPIAKSQPSLILSKSTQHHYSIKTQLQPLEAHKSATLPVSIMAGNNGSQKPTETNDHLIKSDDPQHPANLIPNLCKVFWGLGWVTGTGGGTSIRDKYTRPHTHHHHSQTNLPSVTSSTSRPPAFKKSS
jgi:hypothetical protein